MIWRYRNNTPGGVTQVEIIDDNEVVAVYEYGYHEPDSSTAFEALYIFRSIPLSKIAECLDTFGLHSLRGPNPDGFARGKHCLIFKEGRVYRAQKCGQMIFPERIYEE